jgi:hypothetical protein
MDRCGSEECTTAARDKRWRRRAENRDEWRHSLREAKDRKGL